MGKTLKRILCAGLVITLAVAMAIPALAAAYQKTIKVSYGIGLEYNNVPQTLTDVNGKEVKPFVYEGTTYVPIRGVSELFGADVGYDSETNTAVIYDDFAEACAIVYEISEIASTGFEIALGEYYEAHDGALDGYVTGQMFADMIDYTARYNAWVERAEHIYDLLNDLDEDNSNIQIIKNDIQSYYTDLVMAVVTENASYDKLRSTKNSYWAGMVASGFNNSIQKYRYLTVSTSNFFDDYCTWRDLGF